MPNREHEPKTPQPNELPPELAAFLIDRPYACVTQATDHGTVLVVKAPSRELQTLPGTIPIHIRHELYRHPQAPVIRMVTTIYDRPRNPLALETFINVEDPQQRADIEFDGKDVFFGYVIGDEAELGYFSLRELENNRGGLGLPIERDLFFKPCRLSGIQRQMESMAA